MVCDFVYYIIVPVGISDGLGLGGGGDRYRPVDTSNFC